MVDGPRGEREIEAASGLLVDNGKHAAESIELGLLRCRGVRAKE
jgi:hypothetical protein